MVLPLRRKDVHGEGQTILLRNVALLSYSVPQMEKQSHLWLGVKSDFTEKTKGLSEENVTQTHRNIKSWVPVLTLRL